MSSDPARKIRRRRELEERPHAPRHNPGRAPAWWILRGKLHGPHAEAAAALDELLAHGPR